MKFCKQTATSEFNQGHSSSYIPKIKFQNKVRARKVDLSLYFLDLYDTFLHLQITHFYTHAGAASRRHDMSFLPEMLAPVLVLVVAPTQRPNPTEARPGHGDQSPRLRRPLAGRPDSARPPAHEPISDFGQGLPPEAMGPHRSTRPP